MILTIFPQVNDKKVSAMCYGPAENVHVTSYRMVLERFPLLLDRKKWSDMEGENLAKGIKQQFQEMVLQTSVNRVRYLVVSYTPLNYAYLAYFSRFNSNFLISDLFYL